MKRKPALLCLVIALAVSLLVFYSLMGAMTGVYVYSGDQVGGNGHGFFFRRGDVWYEGRYTFRSPTTLDIYKMAGEHVDIRPGIWAMTVTVNYGHPTTIIRAYPSLNPIDIYRFTFGEYRLLGRSP